MTESVFRERGLVRNYAKEHPEQFGQVLASCAQSERHHILSELPSASLIEVLAYAPRPVTIEFLDTQSIDSILKWIHQGSDDAVARIARRLPERVRAKVLTQIKDVNKLRILREYVHFAKNSVAALADKDFLSFASTMTCVEVWKLIRRLDEDDTDNVLIVSSQDRVLGLLDDRQLLRRGRKEPISSCIKQTTLLPANAPTKSVVALEDWHRVDRLPVIDRHSRAIGILHWKHLIEREIVQDEVARNEDQALIMAVVSSMLAVVKELPGPMKPRPQ